MNSPRKENKTPAFSAVQLLKCVEEIYTVVGSTGYSNLFLVSSDIVACGPG